MKNKKGNFFITSGILLIIISILIIIYNFYDENRALKYKNNILEQISFDTPTTEVVGEITYKDYIINPNKKMPVKVIEGNSYIGVLKIPILDLELPVSNECNNKNLKRSPCRYYGSIYKNNMIIAAHNYKSHFGRVNQLSVGDKVIFKDLSGNEFTYQVDNIETLKDNNVEEMIKNEYDLTLFTCTIGNLQRITIRCIKLY